MTDHSHHLPDEARHGHDGAHGHRHSHGPHGDPAHERPRPVWGRVGHGLSVLVGAHSHGPADQLDATLEADAEGRQTLIRSLAVLGATAAVQAAVVGLSGSVALLGDALHNVADALSAVPLLIAFRLAGRPPTRRYTYGYGRAEDVGGLFVLVLIALSSALAAGEAVHRLLHPRGLTDLWAVGVAAVAGFAGNELVARYRIRVGRRIGSAALVADGLHARTDGFTSLAVLAGAGGVALGWRDADAVTGLVITAAILGILRSAVRQVGARLLDAVDPDLVDQATVAVGSVAGVSVSDLHLRWVGHNLRAEVDVVVAPDLTLEQAHELAHHAEAHLLARLPRLAAATIHASPAGAHREPGAPAVP